MTDIDTGLLRLQSRKPLSSIEMARAKSDPVATARLLAAIEAGARAGRSLCSTLSSKGPFNGYAKAGLVTLNSARTLIRCPINPSLRKRQGFTPQGSAQMQPAAEDGRR